MPQHRAFTLCLLLVFTQSLLSAQQPGAPLTPAEMASLKKEHLDLFMQAQRLYQTGRGAEAMAIWEKALQVEQKMYSKDDPRILNRLNQMAGSYEYIGDYPSAAKKLKTVIQLLSEKHGKNHYFTVDARQALSDLSLRQKLTPKDRFTLGEAAGLGVQFSNLHRAGRYKEAVEVGMKILKIHREIFGNKHPQTALILNNIAVVQSDHGKPLKALPLQKESLEIRKSVQGVRHPMTANGYNNLGMLHKNHGRLEEALPLLQLALSIRKSALGEKHLTTATSYNNVGSVLHDLGEHSKALRHYQLALDIYRSAFGDKHTGTSTCLNNLGLLHLSRGEVQKALPLLKESVRISESILGKNHPRTAQCLNSLASLYAQQGDYVRALRLHSQVLDTQRSVVGNQHPSTATSLNNLGRMYQEKGDLVKALSMFQQALEIQRSVLGLRHPETLTTLSNMADIYQVRGDDAVAIALYQQILKHQKEVLGAKHPGLAINLNNLAGLQSKMGKDKEALSLYQEALQIQKKVLSEEHPLIATILNNIGLLHQRAGKHADALSCSKRALKIERAVLGEKHPRTIATLQLLAALHRDRGDYAKALPLYQKALDISKDAYGDHHKVTGHCLTGLAELHRLRGQFDKAEDCYRKSSQAFLVSRYLVAQSGLGRVAFTSSSSTLIPFCSVLAHNGKVVEAWEWLEKSLGRSTWDDLSARRRLTPAERTEVEALQEQARLLQRRLALRDTKARQTKEVLTLHEVWRKKEAEVSVKLSQLQEKLRDKYGVLGGSSLSLKEIQATLLPEEALVTWADAAQHWGVVVRPKGDPVFVPLPGTGLNKSWTKQEKGLAGDLRKSLPLSTSDWRVKAAALRKQRIEPLLTHLKGIKHLVILPSNWMDGIPIETMVQERTVSYAPSGTIVAFLRTMGEAKGKGLFALGDPLLVRKLEPPQLPEHGLLVTGFTKESNAAKAGVALGDVLLQYHQSTLKTADDLLKAMGQSGLPQQRALKFWRDGKVREVMVPSGQLGIVLNKESARSLLIRKHQILETLARLHSRGWNEIPGSRVEVDAIKARFPQSKAITDAAATERALIELVRNGSIAKYRYLHFATHGDVNRQDQSQSAVILSFENVSDIIATAKLYAEGGNIPDGRLTVEEVRRSWKLDADLVTLSACQSGLGKHERGESYMGFAQAFLLAGSRSTLLSLWKVDDTATALLMDRFYENLLGQRKGIKPMTKVDALAEAKVWLRNLPRAKATKLSASMAKGVVRGKGNPDLPLLTDVPEVKDPKVKDAPYAHPFYWAAFILVGNSR